uniref:Uncharacterized protein n=1 Tax=Romanomermis culicivorax TaxID=13658 RepID=A0A915L748_ROMCU
MEIGPVFGYLKLNENACEYLKMLRCQYNSFILKCDNLKSPIHGGGLTSTNDVSIDFASIVDVVTAVRTLSSKENVCMATKSWAEIFLINFNH